jgi:hypothetical protein
MLIQRDSVSQQNFVAACLVLLLDFLVFERFYCRLHSHNLLLQVQDELFVKVARLFFRVVFLGLPFLFFVLALQVRIAFKFLVRDCTSYFRAKVAANSARTWNCIC